MGANRPENYRTTAHFHRRLIMGSISRAARCLEAQPILDPTEEVCATLRALHPQEPPPPVPTSNELPAAITQEILSNVLKALPQVSAAGPSGRTYEHIKAASTSSEEARAVVLCFVQAVVRGEFPHLPRLLDARLLPLAKPNSRGVRPIAIGEVWYRLTALCALAACPNIGRSLAPLQLAVGISGGSQIVGHALRAGVLADPGCITVQVDWRNAFNTMRRDCMLAVVAQRYPALLPMVAWTYGQHSRLLVQRSDEVVSSQSRVRQGDPLGPLLFALTLQGPLEQVAEMGLARPVAYADDTFQGAQAPTMRAFQALTALATPIGLCAAGRVRGLLQGHRRRRTCGHRAQHAPRPRTTFSLRAHLSALRPSKRRAHPRVQTVPAA
jgi:hypothetical protein